MKKEQHFFLGILLFLGYSCANNAPEQNNIKKSQAVVQKEVKKGIVLKKFNAAETVPFFKDGKWGYANKQKELVIDAVFDRCGFFRNGFAWVAKNEEYGFINARGKQVVDCYYVDAKGCIDGFFPVKIRKIWGFVDSTGRERIACAYEDYCWKGDGTIHVKQNEKWGVIDTAGNQIVPPLYDWDFSFRKYGYAIVSRNNKSGVIDKMGKEILPCQYRWITVINDSMFVVQKSEGNSRVVGIGDREIIPAIYKNIDVTPYGLLIQNGSKCGLYSLELDTIIPPVYTYLGYKNGKTIVAKSGTKYGFINAKQDTLIDFKYDWVNYFVGDIALGGIRDSTFVINLQGDTLIGLSKRSNSVSIVSPNLIKYEIDENRFAFVQIDGNQTKIKEYYSNDYHVTRMPFVMGEVMEFGEFENGFAIVGSKEGRVGMIDKTGKLVVPMNYHHLEPMNEYGFTVGKFWYNSAIVNNKGKQLTEFKYKKLLFDTKEKHFMISKYEDYYDINGNKKYEIINKGYFDYDGNLFISLKKEIENQITEQEIISKIRLAYKKINSGNKHKGQTKQEIGDSLWGIYTKEKLTVVDNEKDIRYEYYYDDHLNNEEPFFIYTREKSKENRYYFYDGHIVRWVDENKQHRAVADALNAPEHGICKRAREHKILFNNNLAIKNKRNNEMVDSIDMLCGHIYFRVEAGMYEQSKLDTIGEGDYSAIEEEYTDSLGNVVFASQSSISLAGGIERKTETNEHYYNGELIKSYESVEESDMNITKSYYVLSYYSTNGEFRTISNESGFDEITDHFDVLY